MLIFSVIAPSINPAVANLIDSLEKQLLLKEFFEVIIIKDISNPISFSGSSLNMKTLSVEDTNPSLMRNLAIKESKGGILAFIDDDAEAFPDWLSKAREIFEKDPQLAVLAGPTMLYPLAPFREKLSYEMAHAKFFGNGHDNLSSNATSAGKLLGHINSCNMFIKKDVLLKMERGFNAALGYGGEDTLLIHHLLRDGYKILYSCQVKVYHRRRKFGAALLKQKFIYRVNNGLMFWVRPAVYWKNPKFAAGFLGITLFAILSLFNPRVFLLGIGVYFLVSYLLALIYIRKSAAMFFALPPALFVQHITYYAGILSGIASIFSLSGMRRIKSLKESVK